MKKFFLKIKKYFEYLYTKIKLVFTQKTFKSSNDIKLRYIFDKNKKSKSLIVVFSACVRQGLKARYNYIRTLKGVKANKLFVLDDFASDKRGCYYLGEYPEYKIEKATNELIKVVALDVSAERIAMCGTSKGAWAAINFGFDNDCINVKTVIIAGAPQYHLGNYLKYFIEAFSFIKGAVEEEIVVNELNIHLKNKIFDDELRESNLKVYLHYSNKEHTFEEHIFDLVEDIKKRGIYLITDVKDYEAHSDVALYYPKFLLSVLKEEGFYN